MSLVPRPLARPFARPFAGVVATVLLSTGLLSGCGVSGVNPGVAARVGDDTVSVRTVDDLSAAYCSAITDQLAQAKQSVPQRYLRSGIAGQLALLAAARQFAAERGVEAGKAYETKVADLKGATAALPAEQQHAVIEVDSSAAYITSVLQAVGEQELSGQDAQDSTKTAAAGQQAFKVWLGDHPVEIDPQFGVAIKDGQAVRVDTSVSVAVGKTAQNGQADTPDPAYVAGLPDAHRCG